MQTTHPLNSDFKVNTKTWGKEIRQFSQEYSFEKLTILEFVDNDTQSFVTFTAQISLNGKDCSFTEKSKFVKIDKNWLYLLGEQV